MKPDIAWERSDRLLSGGTLAVRAVALPEDDELRGAVAVTLHVSAESAQVGADGSVTATLLLGPAEALGISAWLREASQAADALGPPLYSWDPGGA